MVKSCMNWDNSILLCINLILFLSPHTLTLSHPLFLNEKKRYTFTESNFAVRFVLHNHYFQTVTDFVFNLGLSRAYHGTFLCLIQTAKSAFLGNWSPMLDFRFFDFGDPILLEMDNHVRTYATQQAKFLLIQTV